MSKHHSFSFHSLFQVQWHSLEKPEAPERVNYVYKHLNNTPYVQKAKKLWLTFSDQFSLTPTYYIGEFSLCQAQNVGIPEL